MEESTKETGKTMSNSDTVSSYFQTQMHIKDNSSTVNYKALEHIFGQTAIFTKENGQVIKSTETDNGEAIQVTYILASGS